MLHFQRDDVRLLLLHLLLELADLQFDVEVRGLLCQLFTLPVRFHWLDGFLLFTVFPPVVHEPYLVSAITCTCSSRVIAATLVLERGLHRRAQIERYLSGASLSVETRTAMPSWHTKNCNADILGWEGFVSADITVGIASNIRQFTSLIASQIGLADTKIELNNFIKVSEVTHFTKLIDCIKLIDRIKLSDLFRFNHFQCSSRAKEEEGNGSFCHLKSKKFVQFERNLLFNYNLSSFLTMRRRHQWRHRHWWRRRHHRWRRRHHQWRCRHHWWQHRHHQWRRRHHQWRRVLGWLWPLHVD